MINNNSLANRKKTKHTVFETDIEGWSIRFGGRGGGVASIEDVFFSGEFVVQDCFFDA